MPATPSPSASSPRTSFSRGLSCGPVGLSLRCIAPARSFAVNARGETAACRAAAITSSAGASFGTKADAPASRAPNSWSSPAYIVRTTIPIVGLLARTVFAASSPLPSGSRTSKMVTSGDCSATTLSASATVPASPTTVKSPVRSKARRRPSRISSWSSTRTTVMATPDTLARVPSVTDRHEDLRAALLTMADQQLSADPCCPLMHHFQPETVQPRGAEAVAVVLDPQRRVRRVDPAGDPQVLGVGVLARVGDGLLGDAQELGLGVDRKPGRRLVQHQVHRER